MALKEIIRPEGMSPPFAPYSLGVKAGNLIFTHGVMALDEEGRVVGHGNIAVQAKQVIENLQRILNAGGADLEDVVMVQVFLTDFSNYEVMNQVYAQFFGNNPPARFTVGCSLCKPELLVEMAAIAAIGSEVVSNRES
jgi:aminoacrylate peracid reductase